MKSAIPFIALILLTGMAAASPADAGQLHMGGRGSARAAVHEVNAEDGSDGASPSRIASYAIALPAQAREAAPAAAVRPSVDAPAAPVLPQDAKWAGGLLIVVVALFAAAAVIGPVYRLSRPDELPAHSHDEPPGASHHHGPSGTIDYSAPERHRS